MAIAQAPGIAQRLVVDATLNPRCDSAMSATNKDTLLAIPLPNIREKNSRRIALAEPDLGRLSPRAAKAAMIMPRVLRRPVTPTRLF